MGTLIEAIPNMIKVEGHTDNRPIATHRYPSNWELSGARASSVIRYFVENNEVEANRFLATGYGDTRPVVSNTNEEKKQNEYQHFLPPSFAAQDRKSVV